MNKKLPFVLDEHYTPNPKPTLLLHSCCAPCSSSVIEMLREHFRITVLYYNPNIFPESEYIKRCEEQRLFCQSFSSPDNPIAFVAADYRSDEFEKIAKGKEHLREGGDRCIACYALRLGEAARYAAQNGFDYFTTTLSVSPLKDAARLNAIGEKLAKTYEIKYLTSDFKKQNGYKRSCELSKQYGMYRQDFCGCKYSLAERILSAKGFVFDADGTLFDTMGFYETFASEYVRSLGFEPAPDLREQIRSFTIRECCELLKSTYSVSKTTEEIYDEISRMIANLYAKDAPFKAGVLEFLRYAKSKGIKMCIATATDKNHIEAALAACNAEDMFEFVLTCSDVGVSKRESVIYDESAKRLGLEKRDVVVFEDAHHAIVTAKAANYRVVAVREETELKFADVIEANSDIYVETMTQLIQK
ncbi:MAG: epoxyqueuosine reductase QueH [Clostridia bacterium]|nr:epoxyqueuosine reductase QueH [Clostridia bacterium]